MKTILAHFYNEEYLLPRWLEHHKKIFDHGVLIDYRSTDRSREIIKKICPDWVIIDTLNPYFDPQQVEDENNRIQSVIPGWRIFLNITEFLVGDVNQLTSSTEKNQGIKIPIIYFWDWNPNSQLDVNKPLWEQFSVFNTAQEFQNSRMMHNGPINYSGGRHYFIDSSVTLAKIFKYNNCISSPEMLKRRLQSQDKFSEAVMKTEAGWQHHNYGRGLTKEILEEYHFRYLTQTAIDLQMIESFTKQYKNNI